MPQANDIMNPDPPFCGPNTPVAEIAKRFADENISGMLVVDEDNYLLGIITETDLVDQQNLHIPTVIALFDMVIPLGETKFEHELERMQAMTAESLMAKDVQTIKPDADLLDISNLMADEHAHHLPVIDNETIVGMISKHDVIKALATSIS